MSPVFGVWEERFFAGVELFNRKKFYDAHGEWEKLWMDVPRTDPLSDFYKGLIQTAAVFEHIRRQNLPGAGGLLATAPALLQKFAPRTEGLDVRALLADLERVRAAILDTRALESIVPPQIKLWIQPQHP